ncbi:cyclin-dependent kinase 4 inhibitor C-like [Oscarella lobularis]|uniref:cyclin-dependent kinase 4 inhibitor C-like n=1 Tax=Oscarella lobularis TaxID=121494 RepID=UPI0033141DF0
MIKRGGAFTNTHLQKVILSSDSAAVKTTLKDVADINETNKDGETALHVAAGYCDDAEILCLLLREGASWNAMDKNGCAPVHIAARRGQLSIVKALVEWDKANAELPSGEKSEKKLPLHFACEEDRVDIIKYLTNEAKADINGTSEEGEIAYLPAPCTTVQNLSKRQ